MITPNTTTNNGRFQPGNKAAVGHSTRAQNLRLVLLQAITPADVRAIAAKLIEQAKAGDQAAAKILIGFIGKPKESLTVIVPTSPAAGKTSGAELAVSIARRIQSQRQDRAGEEAAADG